MQSGKTKEGAVEAKDEADAEESETAVPLIATWGRLQKRVVPIVSHLKMLNFAAVAMLIDRFVFLHFYYRN